MAKKFLQYSITNRLNFQGYFKKWGQKQEDAAAKVGLQLLNWIVNGSPNSNRVPPLLYGSLYGSGSVFVGSRFISTTPGHSESEHKANRSLNEKKTVITVGFNTPYAAKLHEKKFNLGPVSQKTPGVGYKYIEEHIKSDGPDLMKFFADQMKEI